MSCVAWLCTEGSPMPPRVLDDALGADLLDRMDGVDQAQKRNAPGRNANDIPLAQRRFQIMRRGRANGRENGFLPFLVAFSDDRLAKAVTLPERSLILGIGSARRRDGDANDPLLLGALEELRHGRLGDVQPLGDFGLLELVLVIELGDAKHHSKFIGPAHRGRSSTLNSWRGPSHRALFQSQHRYSYRHK